MCVCIREQGRERDIDLKAKGPNMNAKGLDFIL